MVAVPSCCPQNRWQPEMCQSQQAQDRHCYYRYLCDTGQYATSSDHQFWSKELWNLIWVCVWEIFYCKFKIHLESLKVWSGQHLHPHASTCALPHPATRPYSRVCICEYKLCGWERICDNCSWSVENPQATVYVWVIQKSCPPKGPTGQWILSTKTLYKWALLYIILW